MIASVGTGERKRFSLFWGLVGLVVANLSPRIASIENDVLRKAFNLGRDEMREEIVRESNGPGNVILFALEYENVTEVFTGFGRAGVPAEQVAKEGKQYMASEAPVSKYLADRLLIPVALAGGGSFRTVAPSRHTQTNVLVIQ